MSDPVLIVGAGPTGLVAALELTKQGIPVRLIDKRDAPDSTSRAIGVQARTLELFEQRGLADEMIALGNRGMFGSIYGGGTRVVRLDFAHIESHYPYVLFLSQAETERILRDALATHGVAAEWGTELVAIQQDAHTRVTSPAHAALRNADATLAYIATPWIIGADGAHSVLRTTLALPYKGHTRDEQYALGDITIDGDLADTDFHIFSSDHGFMALFPMGGLHFRLIASHPLNAPLAHTTPALREFQHIYDQRSHIPATLRDVKWSSWFRINSRMVSALKVGRMLLGGDAAHIHSPAGAQGMNTGIQDMINLCWKLALVLKQEASPALLNTYATDRLPVMRAVLTRTDNLTTMIGTENTIVRSLFNHLGPFIGGNGLVQNNATGNMSQIALNYRSSALSEQYSHMGELQAGDRMTEMLVRDPQDDEALAIRLLTLLDPRYFTLLVVSAQGEYAADAWQSTVPDMRILAIAPPDDPTAQNAFTQTFGRTDSVTLVRPDGYVALQCPLAEATERLSAYAIKWFSPAQFYE